MAVPNYTRLEQAHRLWHQTHAAYFDPNGFQANLNSLIEALRNVTFMLQSEKKAISNFDSWYKDIQDQLKKDQILSWLSDARTTVVHKTDLETKSFAIATIHNNLDLHIIKFQVHPFMTHDAIVGFALTKIPKEIYSQREFLVLSIERKWLVESLIEIELLEALAHAYGVISNVVKEAHEKNGHIFKTAAISMEAMEDIRETADGRLPCMITTRESRTCRISLKDGAPLDVMTKKEVMKAADVKKAAKRYKLQASDFLSFKSDPIRFAESLVPHAKRILAKDKHHVRLAFLYDDDNKWRQYYLEATNRQDKYVLMRNLADEVKRIGATAIVEISEVWLMPVAEGALGIFPEQSPNRQEALQISVLKSDGTAQSYTTIFKRNIFGKIIFNDTIMEKTASLYSLGPIMEVWGIRLPI